MIDKLWMIIARLLFLLIIAALVLVATVWSGDAAVQLKRWIIRRLETQGDERNH